MTRFLDKEKWMARIKKVMHSGRMMWHNKDEEDMEGDWVNEDDDTIGEDGEGLG